MYMRMGSMSIVRNNSGRPGPPDRSIPKRISIESSQEHTLQLVDSHFDY